MSLGDIPAESTALEISTERLLLRRPHMTDATALFELMREPRLSEFLAWTPHVDVNETRTVIDSLNRAQSSGAGFHWVVCSGSDPVGLVSLIDVKRTHRSWTLQRAELAYWIGLPYQGRGFATEAAGAVMKLGFGVCELNKLRVYHASTNSSSANTAKKLGFRYVGREEQAFSKGGKWHDLEHYELLREAFFERTAAQRNA